MEAARRPERLYFRLACRLFGRARLDRRRADRRLLARSQQAILISAIFTAAQGIYGGWNWRAVVATLLGCFFAWIGLIIPIFVRFIDYAWFVGFGVAFVVHWGLMKAFPPEAVLRRREVTE